MADQSFGWEPSVQKGWGEISGWGWINSPNPLHIKPPIKMKLHEDKPGVKLCTSCWRRRGESANAWYDRRNS